MKALKVVFTLCFAYLLTAAQGCKEEPSDIDLDSFTAITEEYPYADVNPATEIDYWELVWKMESSESEVQFSAGEKCANAADEDDCKESLNGLTSSSGFAAGCLPAYCYHFIRAKSGEENKLWDAKNEVLEFLGAIDSGGDAILWVFANGYRFDMDNKTGGAIRQTNRGFEMIATRLVSECEPVQTNRFHLLVKPDGAIEVLSEEIYSRGEGCI